MATLNRRLRVVPNLQSETPMRYAQYIPQPGDDRVARAVIRHIHEATPGGIQREQFRPARHPIKTALALFPFAALLAIVIIAAAARHHP